MRAIPIVALVLLAFAAFFLTFLLAPLAVLALFYVLYAFFARRDGPADPPPAPEPRQPWDSAEDEAEPMQEDEPPVAPARRARITVVSRAEQAATEPAPDAEPAEDTGAAPTPSPTPRTA
jgi:hypothetical protein